MSVISTLLPGKENFAIAQAAQRPKSGVERHDDRRDDQREADRRARIRLVEGREKGASALGEGLGEDDGERQQQEQAEKGHGDADQQIARERSLLRHAARRRDRNGGTRAPQTWPNLFWLHAWIRLIASSTEKEIASMIVAMPVAPA